MVRLSLLFPVWLSAELDEYKCTLAAARCQSVYVRLLTHVAQLHSQPDTSHVKSVCSPFVRGTTAPLTLTCQLSPHSKDGRRGSCNSMPQLTGFVSHSVKCH